MTEQTARELLMDYLYDEISEADKQKLEAYLSDNPELQQELDELRKTQSLLQQMPDVEPAEKLLMIDPDKDSSTEWRDKPSRLIPQSAWARTALATAACLMLLLITGALVDLNIQSNEAGFSISFGKIVQPQTAELTDAQTEAIVRKIKKNDKPSDTTGNINALTKKDAERFLTKSEAEALLAKIQNQNKALLTTFAKEMNQQDKQQLQQMIKYFQAQRINDLKQIKQGLNEVELAGAYRWQQTNQVLGELIQTASVKQ